MRYYSGSGYNEINSSLRLNKLNDKINQDIEAIDSALSKGVLEKGTYFYRGGIPAKEFFGVPIDKLQTMIGKEITDPAYMSTSALSYIAKSSFHNDPKTKVLAKIFIPAGKGRGMYIDPISRIPGECEFLIVRNSKYQLLDVYKDGEDVWVIMKLKV